MYIPKRQPLETKIKKREQKDGKNLKVEYPQLDIKDITRLYNEYIMKFNESFNLNESDKAKSKFNEESKINMAQLSRFSDEVEGRNYSFKSSYIREFADEQVKRGYGKNFYKLFIELFLENGDYLFNFSGTENENMERAINKKIIELLKLSMRAFLGENRMEKKLTEISEGL